MTHAGWMEAKAGRINLKLPYAMRDVCKATPAATWDKHAKVWTYPATPNTARTMIRVFKQAGVAVHDREGSVAAIVESERLAYLAIDPDHEPPPIPQTWGEDPPRECQIRSFWFATHLRGAQLGHEMGVGKSRVVVDLTGNHDDIQTALIICPHGVVDVWPEQFAKHGPGGDDIMVVPLVKGTVVKKTELAEEAIERAATRGQKLILVINFESVWRPPFGPDYDDRNRMIRRGFAIERTWDMVVLDEAHRIKAPGGRASWFCSRLRDRAARRIGLTGTPLHHSKLDIYAQYRFLDPSIYGTNYTLFKRRYAVLGGKSGHQVMRDSRGRERWLNEDEFNERFHRISYRVEADEVLDLPPFTHIMRTCDLSPKARRIYEGLADEFWAELDGGSELTPANSLVRSLRFSQITSGHVCDDDGRLVTVDDAKLKLLEDVMQEIAQDEPIVVFCRFRPDLERVHAVAEKLGRTSCELSGSRKEKELFTGKRTVPDGKGGTTVETFTPSADVIAVQVKSGGLGIDLTRSRYCICFSIGWSLGDYEQLLRRVLRPGQTRSGFFIHLVANNTVDVAVYRGLAAGKEVTEEVYDYFRGRSAERRIAAAEAHNETI